MPFEGAARSVTVRFVATSTCRGSRPIAKRGRGAPQVESDVRVRTESVR